MPQPKQPWQDPDVVAVRRDIGITHDGWRWLPVRRNPRQLLAQDQRVDVVGDARLAPAWRLRATRRTAGTGLSIGGAGVVRAGQVGRARCTWHRTDGARISVDWPREYQDWARATGASVEPAGTRSDPGPDAAAAGAPPPCSSASGSQCIRSNDTPLNLNTPFPASHKSPWRSV